MINSITLTGRLTADIELRKTNGQEPVPYVFFTLAVNKRAKDAEADFVSCVAWRGTAELMNDYLKKGSLIGVEGRLEVRRKEEDGVWTTTTNVNVSRITFLESKGTEYKKEDTIKNSEKTEDKISNEINVDEINFDEVEF